MFVGAGLPSLAAQLADATSYAERLYDYRTIGLLDDTAAIDALTIPTHALGVAWDPEALTTAAGIASGYPLTSSRRSASTCGTTPSEPLSALTTCISG